MRTFFLILLLLGSQKVIAQHPGAIIGAAHAYEEDAYASKVAHLADSLLLIAHATFASELVGQSSQYVFLNLILRDIPGAPYTAASVVISVGVEVVPIGDYDFAADERFSSLYILPHADPYEDAQMLYREIMDAIANEKDYWRLTQR